jgi:hypothetical protein
VKKIMNFRFYKMRVIPSLVDWLSSFSKQTLLHAVSVRLGHPSTAVIAQSV